MACNEEGGLLLHIIEETEIQPELQGFLREGDAPDAIRMEMDAPFSLLPKVFKQTEIPGLNGQSISSKLDDAVYLNFRGAPNSCHAATPLYLEAKAKAAGKEYFVMAFIHAGQCTILFFKNGVCELANSYPVANDSEILYYCMAVVKKSGADVRKVHFELLGNQLADLLKVFDRFVPGTRLTQLELPYPAGEYPPHAAESFLLYQYLTCALPVDH